MVQLVIQTGMVHGPSIYSDFLESRALHIHSGHAPGSTYPDLEGPCNCLSCSPWYNCNGQMGVKHQVTYCHAQGIHQDMHGPCVYPDLRCTRCSSRPTMDQVFIQTYCRPSVYLDLLWTRCSSRPIRDLVFIQTYHGPGVHPDLPWTRCSSRHTMDLVFIQTYHGPGVIPLTMD